MDFDRFFEEEKKKIFHGDKYGDLINAARELKSDLDYLNLHMERNRRSKYWFKIVPSIGSYIMDPAFRLIFQALNYSSNYKTDDIEKALAIYEITYKKMSAVVAWDEDRKAEDLVRAIQWSEVFEWFTGEKLRDHIGNFSGTSQISEQLFSAWNIQEKKMADDEKAATKTKAE